MRTVATWMLAITLTAAITWAMWRHYQHPWPHGETSNGDRPASTSLHTP